VGFLFIGVVFFKDGRFPTGAAYEGEEAGQAA
jgi:hypothetical protein